MTINVTIQRPTPPFAESAANPKDQAFLAGLELRKTGADPEGKASGYFLFDRMGSDEPASRYAKTQAVMDALGIKHEKRDGGEKLRLFVEGDDFIKLKSAIDASRTVQAPKAENPPKLESRALKI